MRPPCSRRARYWPGSRARRSRPRRATLLLRDEEDRVAHVLTVGANGGVRAERCASSSANVPAHEFRAWRIAARQPKPIFVENAARQPPAAAELVEALCAQVIRRGAARVGGPPARPRDPAATADAHVPWSNEERRLSSSSRSRDRSWSRTRRCARPSRSASSELAHQAFHDSLTELPNRALFADRLEHALERTNRRKAAVAVLFLDLDDFKPINDSFGHDAGDQLLMAVAQRIKACVRPEDTVARLGGDEFTVLLEDIADVRYAIAVAERIEESLAEPFQVEGQRGHRHRQHRDRGQHRSRVIPGRPGARLRQCDVPGEAQGPRAPRGVPRAGHSRARRRRAGRRGAARGAARRAAAG